MEKMVKENLSLQWLTDLLYSWGSDTPSEVIWGINAFIDYLNARYQINIEYMIEFDDSNHNQIIAKDISEFLNKLELNQN